MDLYEYLVTLRAAVLTAQYQEYLGIYRNTWIYIGILGFMEDLVTLRAAVLTAQYQEYLGIYRNTWISIGILGSIGIPGNFEGGGTTGTIPGILRNL